MKKLNFDIYVGKDFRSTQDKDIVAFIELPSNLPKGNVALNGRLIENTIGFNFLHLVADYIADWIDLVEDEKLIEATVYLNKKSNCRKFKGKEIVKSIDLLSREDNRIVSSSFDCILEEGK
ncbi:MAG: hypothetical protein IJW60_05435 [Clostridia bacterium]|nr:hypothetical protein [Clostridia bacterium]